MKKGDWCGDYKSAYLEGDDREREEEE